MVYIIHRVLLKHFLRIAFLFIAFAPILSRAEIEITLNNSFIEKYKNRATISVEYWVDKAHVKPNAPSKDGDIHIAGRAIEVGLPVVAEIMNASSENTAVDIIHQVEGSGKTIPLEGAWRLWCEHGGTSPQVQGKSLEPFTTTNPDHVFEIHPVTAVEGTSVTDSLHPIQGFEAKDAERAFTSYENLRSKIAPGAKTTKLTTIMGGNNYVEFRLEPNSPPVALEDGTAVFASVMTLDGDLIVHNRRMIFIKDTPPEKALKQLTAGGSMHVLGIPRIDLALVSWRTKNYQKRPEVLSWSLPYEIIVVGAYPD
jgi:hypothetical protein